MNLNTIQFIQDYSKLFIVNLHYKKNGLDTTLYFSNNKFFPEKSIIRESHARILNLINNEWIIIETNDITGYTVEDIPYEKYKTPSLLTDEDLENQKNKIYEKIKAINNKIEKVVEAFKFLKSYMTEEQYNDRFDIEFEKGVENKIDYISKLAYDKVTCAFFNSYFLSKKIGVPLEWVIKNNITEENLVVFKQKWKEYLVLFVSYFVNFLNKEINALENAEADYKEDLKELIKEVEDEVENIHFKEAKTVVDVIKVWPTLIAPAPFFLEDIV